MSKTGAARFSCLAAVLLSLGCAIPQLSSDAQAADAPPGSHRRNAEIGWRLASEDQKYAVIDGAKLKQLVAEQIAFSTKYRDAGHQFWGRIIGTSADAENAQWMLAKFRQLGLSDVHEQVFDLPPQWMAQSWSLTASGGGKSLTLATAQPTYLSVGAPALDLEAVYVGQGSEAEFKLAKDVRGKAVFINSFDLLSRHAPISDGAIKRAEEHGAAAIFVSVAIPGTNYKTQFYPVGAKVPTFSLGEQDGIAIRDLIGQTPDATPARIKVALNVQMTPNMKSGSVWGTLPGMTGEVVYIVAHRDGWFEGANDNGTGVATMLGLAEYFSKIPKAQRRRTIVFLGTTGHHNSGGESGVWLGQHKELFDKAALIFNSEHTSAVDTAWYPPGRFFPTNAAQPSNWYVGGSPKLVQVATGAFNAMGAATEIQSNPAAHGEMGRFSHYAPGIQNLAQGFVWHSDHETLETVSATGLAAITRSYAKIIAETDRIPISELRAPQGPARR